MNKEKNFNIYFISISLFIFIIAVIRVFKMGITYDESITYLNITSKNLLTNFDANNHLLNTFFISILLKLTNLEFNEVIIRIPNLIFYIIYIIYTYKISKLYKNKYLVATILLLNYSLNEFASLARGYTIAASLVLMGIYYYKKWLLEKKDNYLIKSLLILLCSSLANTMTLIVFGTFILDSIIRMLYQKKLKLFIKKYIILLILLLLIFMTILVYHFYVSFSDKYLAMCSKKNLFNCLIYTPITSYGIIFFNKNRIIIAIFLIIIYIIFNIKNYKFKYDNLFYITIIIILFMVIFKLIFPFNYPTGRTLIPFHSIYIISLIDFFNLFQKKLNNYIYLCFILICYIFFFKNLNVNYVREWKENQKFKILFEEKYKKKEKITTNDIVKLSSSNKIKKEYGLLIIFYYKKYKILYSYEPIQSDEYMDIIASTQD